MFREYEAFEKLKDGRDVCVRSIRPEDKTTIVEGFSLFSKASVYKRFHGAKSSLTDKELTYFTEIDHRHHVGLLAVLKENDQAIGGGRYISFDDALPRQRAELAFAVLDTFQGLGVATIILKNLIIIAREVGIGIFEADVLAENRAMIKVFEKSGLPMTRTPEGSSVLIELRL